MNINELEQLAKAATPGPLKLSGTEHVVAGGNYVVALDCRSEDAKHIAAANPSAILELIAAYREACAVVCDLHADGWEKNPGNNPVAGYVASSNCAADIRARGDMK